nr:hypothetical protein [uncultured Carboxylicivirga sp.]
MKKQIENIGSLIEGWCKKKLVFARPLLPFGTVGEAHAQIAHLVFSNPQSNLEKPKELFSCHH